MATEKPGFGEIGNMNELVTLYVDTLRTWIDALPQKQDDAEPLPGSSREILLLLARAQAVWLTSGLRYGRQISELMAQQGLDFAGLSALGLPDENGNTTDVTMRQLALIDKARRFLQQVADASLSEAEALRKELLRIEAELRELQTGGPEAAPKRNVRAKK